MIRIPCTILLLVTCGCLVQKNTSSGKINYVLPPGKTLNDFVITTPSDPDMSFRTTVNFDDVGTCKGKACNCAYIKWNGSCYELRNDCSEFVNFRVPVAFGEIKARVRGGSKKILQCFGGCCKSFQNPYYANY